MICEQTPGHKRNVPGLRTSLLGRKGLNLVNHNTTNSPMTDQRRQSGVEHKQGRFFSVSGCFKDFNWLLFLLEWYHTKVYSHSGVVWLTLCWELWLLCWGQWQGGHHCTPGLCWMRRRFKNKVRFGFYFKGTDNPVWKWVKCRVWESDRSQGHRLVLASERRTCKNCRQSSYTKEYQSAGVKSTIKCIISEFREESRPEQWIWEYVQRE